MRRTVAENRKRAIQKPWARKSARRMVGTDFSVVEDSSQAVSIMSKIGGRAGKKAIAAAKAAGATTAYMINKTEFVKVDASGKVTSLRPVFKRSSYYVTIKPGTKFNARKK